MSDKSYLYQSDDVSVWDLNGVRFLSFDGMLIQSALYIDEPSKPFHPYLHAMMLSMPLIKAAQSVLMIGLGGGSLLHAIRPFLPNAHCYVAESNTEVIRVAREFFFIDKLSPLTIEAKTGEDYLKNNKRLYDGVYIDAFDKADNSAMCVQLIKQAFPVISKKGMLSVNVGAYDEGSAARVLTLMNTLFNGQSLAVTMEGKQNLVIIGSFNQQFSRIVDKHLADGLIQLKIRHDKYGTLATLSIFQDELGDKQNNSE